MVRKTKQWVPVDGTRWRSEVANGRENRRVGALTTLLIVVSWRPFASYQLSVDFGVLGGALAGVLALFFTKH